MQYITPTLTPTQPQRIESAAVVWDLIQNCLDILEISQEEAQGLWSLLAAIYHLGYAGVKKGEWDGEGGRRDALMSEFLVRFCDLRGRFIVKVFL